MSASHRRSRRTGLVARRRLLIFGTLVLVGGVVGVSPALASTSTVSSPTSLSGSRTLSSTGLTAQGAGVTATTDLVTAISWTQAASLSTTFDPNLVRQARAVNPTDAYTRTSPGSMTLSWTLANTSVAWDGIGPLGLGSPSFSATGPCDLVAGGSDYVCHLSSSQQSLIDTYPVPGPYVKLSLAADVTITPQGLSTLRQASFAGTPDGPASLLLGESPITDSLSVPCTVGVGDSLGYALGALSATDCISVATSLVFDVGAEAPNPLPPFNELDVSFATPSIPIDTTASSITMSGDGATFDLGSVLANNVPPTASAGGPYAGDEGSTFHFDGSASTSVCGFPTLQWNFSDGGVAYGAHPDHVFPGSGVYSGLLTATDVTGLSSTTTFSATVANLPPAVSAGPDTTSVWGVAVTFNGAATDPGSADQATLTYSWAFGDGSPSASGGASTTHAYATPGDYTATLTSCDQYNACASDSRVVHVTKRDTTTAYLGPSTGTYDTAANLSASVVDQLGLPVNAATVSFAVGTDPTVTGQTGSSGTATAAYAPGLGQGSYPVSASFAGNALYNASGSVGQMAVSAKGTVTSYTGAVTGRPNKTVALSATLADAQGTALAGRTITFTLGSQSTTAITDVNGVAATTLQLAQKNGTYTVAATFTPAGPDVGDYLGSSAAATFKLQTK